MKISTLEYFVALAEYQSINKAAQSLYIAQPSLSKALSRMEEEIGVPLFLREAKGIRLTEAGEKILPEARQVLKYYQGWKDLANTDSLEEIEIYTQSVFAHFFLPNILLDFKKAYPGVKVTLNPVLKPGEYISRETGKPVLCLVVCNSTLREQFTEKQGSAPLRLMDGEYQCILNPSSPLAGCESVTVKDLRDLYFTMAHFKGTLKDDSFLYPLFRELFSTIPGSHTMEAESLANVVSLIARNPEVFTISYFPIVCLAEGMQDKLSHIPLQGWDLRQASYLFFSQSACRQHPALKELIHLIRSGMAELQNRRL